MLAVQLPSTDDSARRARNLIRQKLGGRIPDERLHDLLTVVTELVANAVRHGEGRRIGLALEMTSDGEIRGEVQNKGVGKVEPRPVDIGRSGGLGLHIVQSIVDRWDVSTNGITRVSFALRTG